jgi:hypothetical protein
MPAVRRAITIVALFLAGVPALLVAQEVPGVGNPALFLGVGAFDYSLRTDGRTPMFAGRLERDITNYVIGEGGFLYARVRQPGGDEATNYLVPELQVQFQHRWGRVAPYVGVGGGATLDFRPDSLHTNATVSASVGVRAWLGEITALRSEFRVRAVGGGREGGGSSRELVVGVLIRLLRPEE